MLASNHNLASPAPEITGNVTTVCLSQSVRTDIMQQLPTSFDWECLTSAQQLAAQLQQGILQADTVILDAAVKQPIQVSQRIHSFDKTIPVLILTEPQQCADLRRSIMFSPLLGHEVTPWSFTDIAGLANAVATAVERHQQRRHYLDTIASAQPRLGNLTLSQPEIGHYLGRLLNQAPIGVISLDGDGRIVSINRQAGELLGTTERETLGVNLSDFFLCNDQLRLANLLTRSAVAQAFGTKPEVFERATSANQAHFLEATACPIAYQSGQRGYMVILQDVTARERAEMQRKKSEGLMRILSGALEQAADSVMKPSGKKPTFSDQAFTTKHSTENSGKQSAVATFIVAC